MKGLLLKARLLSTNFNVDTVGNNPVRFSLTTGKFYG